MKNIQDNFNKNFIYLIFKNKKIIIYNMIFLLFISNIYFFSQERFNKLSVNFNITKLFEKKYSAINKIFKRINKNKEIDNFYLKILLEETLKELSGKNKSNKSFLMKQLNNKNNNYNFSIQNKNSKKLDIILNNQFKILNIELSKKIQDYINISKKNLFLEFDNDLKKYENELNNELMIIQYEKEILKDQILKKLNNELLIIQDEKEVLKDQVLKNFNYELSDLAKNANIARNMGVDEKTSEYVPGDYENKFTQFKFLMGYKNLDQLIKRLKELSEEEILKRNEDYNSVDLKEQKIKRLKELSEEEILKRNEDYNSVNLEEQIKLKKSNLLIKKKEKEILSKKVEIDKMLFNINYFSNYPLELDYNSINVKYASHEILRKNILIIFLSLIIGFIYTIYTERKNYFKFLNKIIK